MVTTDEYWTIHTKGRNTVVATDAMNEPGELNQLTRGGVATFTFRTTTDSLTVESGETHTVVANTTEIYTTVSVKENGDLNVEENGRLITTGTGNFAELQKYEREAGNFTTSPTLNRTQKYREFLPSDADVDSLVVGIEPSQALQDLDVVGKWGIITAANDTRRTTLTNDEYEVEVRILDDFDAYADHTAVADDLEV